MEDNYRDKEPGAVSDFELGRREQVDYYMNKGMDRRGVLKKMGLTAALTSGVVASLAACTGSSEAEVTKGAAASGVAKGAPIKFLDVGFGDVIDWCGQIRDSTKFWGQFFNLDITHIDGGADPATQLKRYTDATSTGKWDVVAVCPVASNTLAAQTKKLIDGGTAVIQQAVDIGKPGEDIGQLTFISQNYENVGFQMANDIFTKMGGKGTAIVTQGVAGTGNVIGRHDGVQKALKVFPDVELLAEDYTDYSDAASKKLWSAYAQKYKKIDAALTFTTGSAALNGTYAALKSAGREKDVLIGSNNAEDFACQAVIDGKFSNTVRHSSVLLGMWAAVIGAQHKGGALKDVPKISWIPEQLINDKGTAQSMIDMQRSNVFLA